MALLERVSTLLRANVSDLLTKAEDPEKLARQLVLDMENQLIQVKTQVAISIADQHLLEKKKTEQEEAHAQWLRKAEAAVAKGQDDLARTALERAVSHQRLAEGLAQQCADQGAEADTLRATYSRLQQKLTETQARVDILAAQLRRNRAMEKVATAQSRLQEGSRGAKFGPLKSKVDEAGSSGRAARTMLDIAAAESLEERFTSGEQSDQIEALLLELKERQPRLG
jgi:phage shock protein A